MEGRRKAAGGGVYSVGELLLLLLAREGKCMNGGSGEVFEKG